MPESTSKSRGVLYFAKGDTFIREAVISAQRTKEVMPEYPITLIADREVGHDCFDQILLDTNEFEWADKPAALSRSPYDRTLYLDVDVHVEDHIGELFDLLNQFEFASRTNRDLAHIPAAPDDTPIEGVPSGFPEMSSGVLAYKDTPNVTEMFTDWERRGRIDGAADQRSLRSALYHSNVRFCPIENRYNCLYRADNTLDGRVKVFHGALLDRSQNQVDLEHARTVLNSSEGFRIYRRYRNTLFVNPPLPLSYRINVLSSRAKDIYRNHGIRSVIRKTSDKALSVLRSNLL